jgi:hypothetical protein
VNVVATYAPDQLAALDHVIDMRLDLAERETHLVRIQRPPKHEGHNLSSRAWYSPASCRNGGTTLFVMANEFSAPDLRLPERQLMPG